MPEQWYGDTEQWYSDTEQWYSDTEQWYSDTDGWLMKLTVNVDAAVRRNNVLYLACSIQTILDIENNDILAGSSFRP